MNYTVVWLPEAEEELVRLWTVADSPTRREITQAVDRFDRAAQADPLDVGESREDNLRLAIEPPLAFLFDVNEVSHLVRVREIWRIR